MSAGNTTKSTTLADAWNAFWFTPGPTLPLAMLRIGVGTICLWHFVSFGMSSDRWFGNEGMIPQDSARFLMESAGSPIWQQPSLLWLTDDRSILLLLHVVAIVAAAAFTVGLFTRVSGTVALVMLLSYAHRAPFVSIHGDPILAFMMLYLVLGPCGQMFSWDRMLANRRGSDLPLATKPSISGQISLRLIQVHLAMFYGMMGLTKLHGDSWWDGEAIWQLLAQTQSRPSDWTSLRSYPLLINLWTHAQVWLELGFAVLIWNRYFRNGLLVATSLLWLMFIQITGMATYGLVLMVAGLAFLPEETWQKGLGMLGFDGNDKGSLRRR